MYDNKAIKIDILFLLRLKNASIILYIIKNII